MGTHTVTYSCETADGKTGFGSSQIICDNEIDAEAVFDLILQFPNKFDFADIEPGQKRLVHYKTASTYLD